MMPSIDTPLPAMRLNIVAARTGVLWVKQGLRTFFKQPLALSGLFLMFIITVSLGSLIPYLGNVLALAVLPAATLGLMAATREAEQGKFPMPLMLISAFRAGQQQTRAMWVLGAIYALGFLVVLGVSALLDGGQFARLYLVGGSLSPELIQSTEFQWALYAAMAVYMPLSLLLWHAPALVHWHGISPLKSLFFSAVACLKNFGAMTVFSLTWLGLFLGVGVLLIVISALLGQPELMGVLMLPTTMLLGSMFFTSIHLTFRDSFSAQTEPPQETEA
jgi:small basic protein